MMMTATPTTPPSADAQTEKATAPTPAPAKPEPPFSVDALKQSTARFTHQGWGLFLAHCEDLDAITYKRFAFTVEARSEAGATELATLLAENAVGGVNQFGINLTFPSTFAKLQTIIKHPQVKLVNVLAIA